jgi:drug/metabolite transporter (DMT)-like permease
MPAASGAPRRWLVITAFACVYVIWGSSYLGISIAIETIPPFLMTCVRFLLAGGLLVGWALARGERWPTRIQWRAGFIAGGMLFLVNNALIVFAELIGVPTGIVALLVGTTPMWIVILNAIRARVRPNAGTIAGLALGTLGIALLVDLSGALAGGASELVGALVVITAALFWALGSMYARGASLPANALLSTGMQLLCGGVLQIGLALVHGDFQHFDAAAVSGASVLAMLYLAIFASIVAFTAFTWLMRVSNPALVSTYAYVNPVIAVVLGALFRGEALTTRTLVAGGVILLAVFIITRSGSSRSAPTPARPAPAREAA